MVWLFLFIHASAFVCHKSCLDICKLDPNTKCISDCCPEIKTINASSCSLICDEVDGIYQCNDVCNEKENSCENNCEQFCDNRAPGCKEECLDEFCGHQSNVTNWIFVVGIIMLFCVFIVVLIKSIANVHIKIAEIDSGYI
ncbi:hypothetical protein SteCoe_6916 [Stentor coeruleus]|uniref:4Fe-4S ferredoxin-type domain-containing protein n=1 Tax=Stentor coeruleus TaxID=5963 RepID=A0A1R2CNT9_9CILI|nr:hypothetical protein SteCoe_6916 [Stentor coeruleus]